MTAPFRVFGDQNRTTLALRAGVVNALDQITGVRDLHPLPLKDKVVELEKLVHIQVSSYF
ncbi:hypothetical protein D3C80_2215710 [compost metagenome]